MTEIYIENKIIEEQKRIAAELKNQNPDKRIFIKTYGCQQNVADSEKIAGIAILCGYSVSATAENADLIVINTCAIREHAELRVLSFAGKFRKEKLNNPSMLIAICGCMTEQPHRREKFYKSYPYVDFIFGTDKLHLLPEMITEASKSPKRLFFFTERAANQFGNISEGFEPSREYKHRANISVMYGCNNFCTYCIVPYVRGTERSRKTADIIYEAEKLIDGGCREITLLGQNVNSYSAELDFPRLLDRIANINGDFWIRFMTSHPKDASRDLIDVMSGNEKIARHFHLPLQSGSDRILGLMNRKYTIAEYMEKAEYIKLKMPDCSLTSDIIIGFPTEDDIDFDNTVSMVSQIEFDMLFTFIYSPRKGSRAFEMEGRIPKVISNERFTKLSDIETEIALRKNREQIGRTVQMLTDVDNSGRNTQNKLINYDGNAAAGEFVNAKIIGAKPFSLQGEIIK